jgi:hypothetical protein
MTWILKSLISTYSTNTSDIDLIVRSSECRELWLMNLHTDRFREFYPDSFRSIEWVNLTRLVDLLLFAQILSRWRHNQGFINQHYENPEYWARLQWSMITESDQLNEDDIQYSLRQATKTKAGAYIIDRLSQQTSVWLSQCLDQQWFSQSVNIRLSWSTLVCLSELTYTCLIQSISMCLSQAVFIWFSDSISTCLSS